nr:xylulose kinase-1 [Tanacetum cinerariifolium]
MSMRGTYRCSEESKARTTLLQSIPDDHVADFHYMDDAKDIWNAVKARTGDVGEFTLMGVTSEVHNCPFGCDNKYNELKKQYNELNEQNNEYFIQDQAYKNSLKALEKQKIVLRRNQLTLEDKIRVLSIELKNTSNLLKHSERINADFKTYKKDLQTKLDNHLAQTAKWRNSSKNMFRLIDSSMFAKTDSMKVVPPPLSGDYTSLSDHSDLDESQMSYVTSLQRPKVKPVPTGKPKVAPVPTGKPKVSTPVPTGKPKVSHQFLLVCQIGLFQFLLIEDIPHRYVVITGRVIVPTGRISVIPTGRIVSPGKSQIVIPG